MYIPGTQTIHSILSLQLLSMSITMKTRNILHTWLTLSLFFHFSPALCSQQVEIVAEGVSTAFTPKLTTAIPVNMDNKGHLYIEPDKTPFLQGQVLVDLTNLPTDALSFQAPAYTSRKRKESTDTPEKKSKPNKRASVRPSKKAAELPPKDTAQPTPINISESNKENIENHCLNWSLPINRSPLHLLLERPEQPHLSGIFTPICRHKRATSQRLQPSYLAPDLSGGQYAGGIPLGYSRSSTEEFKATVENYYQLTHPAEAKNYLKAFEVAKEDYSLPLSYRSQAACYIEEIYIFMQQHDALTFDKLDKLSRIRGSHRSTVHMANFLKAFLRCMDRTPKITDSQAMVYLNTVIESGNLPDKYTLAAKFLRGMLHCLERQKLSSDTVAIRDLHEVFNNEAILFDNPFLQQVAAEKINYMKLWLPYHQSIQNEVTDPDINVNEQDVLFLINFYRPEDFHRPDLNLSLRIESAKLAGFYLQLLVKNSTVTSPS